jgi:hypothetical protein
MKDHLLRSWSTDRVAWLVSAALGLLAYVAVALATPIALARLPVDYLVRPPTPQRPLVRAARAVLGAVLTGTGVALLFLPGPGMLTILVGLSVIGGPQAERAARRLAGRPRVLAAIDAVRTRRGRPPLVPPRARD